MAATVRNDKEKCIIIGLPDATIKESRERILNNLHSLNLDIEIKKITIILYPVDLKKAIEIPVLFLIIWVTPYNIQ